MSLKGTKTKENLEAAFAGESQANRRYLYFAQKADIEGYNDVASVFRSTAEGETGCAKKRPAGSPPRGAMAINLSKISGAAPAPLHTS